MIQRFALPNPPFLICWARNIRCRDSASTAGHKRTPMSSKANFAPSGDIPLGPSPCSLLPPLLVVRHALPACARKGVLSTTPTQSLMTETLRVQRLPLAITPRARRSPALCPLFTVRRRAHRLMTAAKAADLSQIHARRLCDTSHQHESGIWRSGLPESGSHTNHSSSTKLNNVEYGNCRPRRSDHMPLHRQL